MQMAAIDGLRYRCEEALATLTPRAIVIARKQELINEALASEKLKVCITHSFCHSSLSFVFYRNTLRTTLPICACCDMALG
jgi:hypothetical protein